MVVLVLLSTSRVSDSKTLQLQLLEKNDTNIRRTLFASFCTDRTRQGPHGERPTYIHTFLPKNKKQRQKLGVRPNHVRPCVVHIKIITHTTSRHNTTIDTCDTLCWTPTVSTATLLPLPHMLAIPPASHPACNSRSLPTLLPLRSRSSSHMTKTAAATRILTAPSAAKNTAATSV